MMSLTRTRGVPATPKSARSSPRSSFSALPRTRSTSGMAAKVSGSIWAAQPATTIGRLGMLAARLADRLARLAHGFGGDGAGVDEDGVAEAGFARRGAHDLGFQRIQPAAEGDDVDPPVTRAPGGAARSAPAISGASRGDLPGSVAGSRVPSNSVSTGPVIQTWPSPRHSMTSGPPGKRHGRPGGR